MMMIKAMVKIRLKIVMTLNIMTRKMIMMRDDSGDKECMNIF